MESSDEKDSDKKNDIKERKLRGEIARVTKNMERNETSRVVVQCFHVPYSFCFVPTCLSVVL